MHNDLGYTISEIENFYPYEIDIIFGFKRIRNEEEKKEMEERTRELERKSNMKIGKRH